MAQWQSHRAPARLDYVNAFAPDAAIVSDPALKQVIGNIFDNALEASPDHVSVRIERREDELAIVVENDGAALSAAQQERLFEPFSPTSERREHGNGLGLWICYQIVTQLNGKIRAESADALTRFLVTLPLEAHRDTKSTVPD